MTLEGNMDDLEAAVLEQLIHMQLWPPIPSWSAPTAQGAEVTFDLFSHLGSENL